MVRDAARSTSYIRQEKYTTIRLICRSQMIQPRNAGLKPICVCGSAGRKQPKSTNSVTQALFGEIRLRPRWIAMP